MRQKIKTIDPDAADANGIFTIASISGAGALTLDGALVTATVAIMDYARRIGIINAGDDSGDTYIVVGTDADSRAITETITGGNAATVESSSYFLTITSITASGASAGNVTIGTVDEFVSNTVPVNHWAADAPSVSIEAITGTIDVSVEETFSMMRNTAVYAWHQGPAGLTAITSAANSGMDNHITGIRLVCNSYTTGADLKMVINQNAGG